MQTAAVHAAVNRSTDVQLVARLPEIRQNEPLLLFANLGIHHASLKGQRRRSVIRLTLPLFRQLEPTKTLV
jgi:hypothetical protein